MNDISVVMATYNGERFIEKQIRSILAQTLAPLEIIVSDDGSTDSTVDIVRRLRAESAIPIELVVNETNLGYGPNFLQAARRARGRFVAFSDQDDIWHPNKLARSRTVLQEHGAVLVGHQMNMIDEDDRFLRLNTHGTRATRYIAQGEGDPFGVFFGFTMTFERRLLDLLPAERRGPDSFKPSIPTAHDRWVYFLGTTFGSVVLLAEPLADYRQHAAQSFGIIRSSTRSRIAKKVQNGREQVWTLARVARLRRTLIDEFTTLGQDESVDWARAAERWRRIDDIAARRARSYFHPSFPARVLLLASNAARGAYRPWAGGGLGRDQLPIDVVAGALGPLLRRAAASSR